ncbi:MAG: exodeoxyribonuclease VII small subunit [Helicobacter sp.]|nr:exodeoxyribonuclease VII small subunit [Helicobacter sp.]
MTDSDETFESKIHDIEGIIARLSSDEVSLDESLKLYAQGSKKLKEAQQLLEKANLMFEEIKRENASIDGKDT